MAGLDVPLSEWSRESLLPMDLIREHCGIDDVETVSDTLVQAYRDAAFESAEKHTGRNLTKQTLTYQQVPPANSRDFRKGYQVVTLKRPVADGLLYVYGGASRQVIRVDPEQQKVRVPMVTMNITVGRCSESPFNNGVQLMYKTGALCPDDIPAGIKLGILKYIAWSVKNPGDDLITVKQTSSVQVSGITGTNDVAYASGAIELWKQYTVMGIA